MVTWGASFQKPTEAPVATLFSEANAKRSLFRPGDDLVAAQFGVLRTGTLRGFRDSEIIRVTTETVGSTS